MRLRPLLTVLVLSTVWLTLPVAAQVQPLAAPFRLTSTYDFDGRADYISYGPRVVPLAGGGFAAAWQSIEEHTRGGPGLHFATARALGPAGGLLPESFLASGTPPWQVWPQSATVAADGTGGFLAVWDDTTEISVQPFGPDGASRHAVWNLGGDPGEQAVAAEVSGIPGNANGDFAIAWQTQKQDPQRFGLLVQVFHADGTPVTPKITIPVRRPRLTGIDHRIGIDRQGRFVVVWRDDWSLRGQIFDRTGVAAGSPFTIADRTATKAIPICLAVAPDGGFAVAWGNPSLSLRTYTAAGVSLGKTRTLSGKLLDLATDSHGNLALAALESDTQTSRLQISLFDRRLTPQGQALILHVGPALTGALALADSGQLLIVWGGRWITWPTGAEQAPLLAQLWQVTRSRE
ncbi:MAG TPA: hypothetical protein VH988_28160 [Thermoanaerobaculia bacterium]|jgi:hypothetical protein|nr:hypothetical protein [Thermoanaerobaculia bacterium]